MSMELVCEEKKLGRGGKKGEGKEEGGDEKEEFFDLGLLNWHRFETIDSVRQEGCGKIGTGEFF